MENFIDGMWDGDVPGILQAMVPGGFYQDDCYYAPCPLHADLDFSFCYQKLTRTWNCSADCGNGDLLALAVRLWSCGVDEANQKILALCEREPSRVVQRYPYLDAEGQFVFEVLRYSPKNFARRFPMAWMWKEVVGSASEQGLRILYRLPEVIAADEVFIVEGEKDCETARSLGLVATCNPGGSSRWHQEYVETFRGKRVQIIADGDDGGRLHARQIAGSLVPVAGSVKMIEFAEVKDLTEWVEAGGTANELLEMFWKAPALHAEDVENWWDPEGTVQLQCGARLLLDPTPEELSHSKQERTSADECCDLATTRNSEAGDQNIPNS